VHGSDRCFRKFLNAARFYDVNTIVLGGDMTGKALIPVVQAQSGWDVAFNGNSYTALDERGLAEVEQQINDLGMYPIRGAEDELRALEDPEACERAFDTVVVRQMERWITLAGERLADSGVTCLIAPGNDDHWVIDSVLKDSTAMSFAEGECITLPDGHEVITTGYSNETPWKTERELSEPELEAKMDAMFAEVRDPERLILVAHAPPKGTDLDQAPALDADFRVQLDLGAPRLTSVGSVAVRSFIERRQPLLALHGHVHESHAITELGRTICINPGSEYGEGILRGALVRFDRHGSVATRQLVAG
jgi:uncharacterized protein